VDLRFVRKHLALGALRVRKFDRDGATGEWRVSDRGNRERCKEDTTSPRNWSIEGQAGLWPVVSGPTAEGFDLCYLTAVRIHNRASERAGFGRTCVSERGRRILPHKSDRVLLDELQLRIVIRTSTSVVSTRSDRHIVMSTRHEALR
jgi:hypothetical protein